MSEKSIENDIKKYLEQLHSKTGHYCYYYKNHGNAFTKKGIPDIVGCYMGCFFAIEVKDLGLLNTQTEVQKIHMRNIIKSQGYYLITDNLNDVVELINDIKRRNYNVL